ncbi:MAG: penicillin-binding protein [Gemmatimonadetes bacterium]|nr:penicillin-binding protein [Gemmatimonadota bacterium]
MKIQRFKGKSFTLLVLAVLAMVAPVVWIALPLPQQMTARPKNAGVTITDRNGLPLRSTRAKDGSVEQWVAYEHIDPDVINAFVAVEDGRFWDHHGVDVRAIARAVRENILEQRVTSGASTITMQLARVLHPTPRRFTGKLTQAMWALRLEAHLSKQQILEQYLNRVQLGQATVGVGAATALYFNTSASAVSLGQAATLAGVAHAPSRDNPYVSPRRAASRRAYALRRMRALGLISNEELTRVRDERLRADARAPQFFAPHFTTRVVSWASQDSSHAASIRTSLDLELQTSIEAEVRHTVEMLKDRGVEHAAAVVLDNATGEIRAWVGSPDFWDPNDGQTDMVVSARQPGSALKPFLYGIALDRGLTAATVLPDLPKAYSTSTGSYSPHNYDRRFRGPVRARESLASSYNVPTVEVAARIGVSSLLQTLRLSGFRSLQRDAEYYGLGLALGNGDVTLLELANGYRMLANGGAWKPWSWKVGSAASETRVISPAASAIILDILSDANARIPGFGLNTPFDFPFPVAVKTGTSRHFTDNWAIATTHGFTVAVWAGNFNGHPMQGVSGITGAGPLLHRAVMETAKHIAPGAFARPNEVGAVSVPVCRLSGMLATPTCAKLDEWFVPGSAPTALDDWEQGGHVTLPVQYADWAAQSMPAARVASLPVAGRSVPSGFRITSPRNGDKYGIPAGTEAAYATISLRAAGSGSIRWLVDGQPYNAPRWQLKAGRHVFRATSARGETAEAEVVVEP